MDSDFDCPAAFSDGIEEVVINSGESNADASSGGKGDGSSVLSHVEALVNACFPDDLEVPGTYGVTSEGSGDGCVLGDNHQSDLQQAANASILPVASREEIDSQVHGLSKVSPTAGEAPASAAEKSSDAHGTKRRIAAVDSDAAESEYGRVADAKASDPSSAELASTTGTTSGADGEIDANVLTAKPHSASAPAEKAEVKSRPDEKSSPSRKVAQPENPMILEVTRFLLDKVRQAASDSKLELREKLKADLERFKGDLSLKDRSKMRSRREAAVSRESRIAYTKGLEALVLDLVRGNMLLLEDRNMKQSRTGGGVANSAATVDPPVLALTGKAPESSLEGDGDLPSTAAPPATREKTEDVAAASGDLDVSTSRQRKKGV